MTTTPATYTLTDAGHASRRLARELPESMPDALRHAVTSADTIAALADAKLGEDLAHPVPTYASIAQDLADQAARTGTAPSVKEVRDRAAEARQAQQVDAALAQVLNIARDGVRTTQGEAITACLEEAFGVIRSDIDDVLTQARAAARVLAGLDHTDAAAVAAATGEQRKAIAALPVLAERYNEARRLQRDLLVCSSVTPTGHTPHSPDHGNRAWLTAFATGVHDYSGITRGDHGPSTDMTPVAFLLAVAARSDVWVPSPEQAEDCWDAVLTPRTRPGYLEGDAELGEQRRPELIV